MPGDKYLNLRVTEEERELFKQAAASRNMSLTRFILDTVRAEATREPEQVLEKPVPVPAPAPAPMKQAGGYWDNRKKVKQDPVDQILDKYHDENESEVVDTSEWHQDEQGYWFRYTESGKRSYDP